MAQNNPSVTPMTGNPVVTTYTLTAIVSLVIALIRAYGTDITQDQENMVITFLQGEGGLAIIAGFGAVMAWWARRRAYSELSVKELTGEERPPV